MELFTLGAGRGYTERDVREQARALTGFENDWRRGVGVAQLPLRARPPRRGQQAHLRQDGRLRLAGRRAALPRAQAASLLLRRQALALLRPDDPRRRHSALAREPLPQGLPDPCPSSRRSSATPRSTPARAWSSRLPSTPPGLLRALGRGVDTQSWAWLSSGTGQRLFMPPNVAGWDDERWLDTATFRGRWEVANYATQPFSLTDKQSATTAGRAAGARRRRARLLGQPDDPPGDPEGAPPLRHEGDVRCRREVEADELPVPRRERRSAS